MILRDSFYITSCFVSFVDDLLFVVLHLTPHVRLQPACRAFCYCSQETVDSWGVSESELIRISCGAPARRVPWYNLVALSKIVKVHTASLANTVSSMFSSHLWVFMILHAWFMNLYGLFRMSTVTQSSTCTWHVLGQCSGVCDVFCNRLRFDKHKAHFAHVWGHWHQFSLRRKHIPAGQNMPEHARTCWGPLLHAESSHFYRSSLCH